MDWKARLWKIPLNKVTVRILYVFVLTKKENSHEFFTTVRMFGRSEKYKADFYISSDNDRYNFKISLNHYSL